ncbi:nucleotidyltransferase family protein [Magnetospira thiophila]
MKDWRDTIVASGTPIQEAIRILDETAAQICLVVDGEDRLLGTVTDGDIRRGLLRAVQLSEPVERVMKRDFVASLASEDKSDRIKAMVSMKVHQLPIIDPRGRIVGLEILDKLVAQTVQHDNWVLLMAGGLGTRLHPLTHTKPKPLIEVGGKPILETILAQFVRQGFHRFFISVNYRREMIKSHFGDGERWGAEILYLDEPEALGTAGALGLVPEVPDKPMIVMNGDLLTKVNFEALLDFHRQSGAHATMAVREYDFQVPFGVVDLADDRITDIIEKPVHRFLVNAGLYVIAPEVLSEIPGSERFDMPDLFRKLIAQNHSTKVFPIREYWLDIGRSVDLDRAREEFGNVFDEN